jgi:hypothetical protein
MEEGDKIEVYNALGKNKLIQSIRCCPNRNEACATWDEVPQRRKKSPDLKTRATAAPAVLHSL